MPELNDEKKQEHSQKQKELSAQYKQNVAAEYETMFDSPAELEKAVERIGNTSPNFSLNNRIALAHQGIYDSLMTREGWKRLGFTPKGENVVTAVSVINGDYVGSDGKKRPSFKQKAVYGTQSMENPAIASMAFDEHRKNKTLTGYNSKVRSSAFQAAAKFAKRDLPKDEKTPAEYQIASYLYRKDNRLLKHDAEFHLLEGTEISIQDSSKQHEFINRVTNYYHDFDEKARQVAFAKTQELAKEAAKTPEAQRRKQELDKEDTGLTLS